MTANSQPVHELSNREIVEEANRYAELLKHAGVVAHAAQAAALRKYPGAVAALAAVESKRANILEKDEQRAIQKMAIAVGFKVYWLSQAERSGQTPGLGDLWMVHVGRSVAGWWESKRQVGGERSRVQEDFGDECLACSVRYGFGDRYEFARWLTQHGFTAPPIPE